MSRKGITVQRVNNESRIVSMTTMTVVLNSDQLAKASRVLTSKLTYALANNLMLAVELC